MQNYSSIQSVNVGRFSTKRGAVNFRSKSGPIALSDLVQIAPSVGASEAHGSRSERYGYVSTLEVLTALGREGFHPYSVTQAGSKDADKRAHTKHLVRLRHESTSALAVNDRFHEIVLLNSHDGTSSWQLFSGVFRLVCANGMIASDGGAERVRVSHTLSAIPKVVDGCVRILSEIPNTEERIHLLAGHELTRPQAEAFAAGALVARFDVETPSEAPIKVAEVLSARRGADRGRDAWSVLNVVQENLIKGGIGYRGEASATRRAPWMHTRPVNSADQDVKLNRALWAMMEHLVGATTTVAAE